MVGDGVLGLGATLDKRSSALWSGSRHASRRRNSRASPACALQEGRLKEDSIEMEGTIQEALSNGLFSVKLDNDVVVLGHLAGKMRKFRIRVLQGDRVKIELSPYDLSRGRITYRKRA